MEGAPVAALAEPNFDPALYFRQKAFDFETASVADRVECMNVGCTYCCPG